LEAPDVATTGEAPPRASPAVAAVELEGITKRFGDIVACDGVDLAVERGEIHGLLGQNGAGKSTLMKILLGIHTADAGRILIGGRPVVISDPQAAAAIGVAMVHQHFSVIDALTVWENVTLGERGRVDPRAAIHHVDDLARRYGLDVDPRARVGDLTTGQRQRVEIVKCLRRNPDILILDEPTSVLTLAESDELFAVLRSVVRDEGRAVVLISHKLDEILHATDRVTIMRDGRVIARHVTNTTTASQLAHEMVGRDVSLRTSAAALGLIEVAASDAVLGDAVLGDAVLGDGSETPVAAADAPPAAPVLQITDAVATAADGRRLLDGLTLDVRGGEILGLAGVDGNGQAALGALLSSLLTLDAGTVEVDGRVVPTGRPGAMMRAGVGVIPEDRHESGCVLGMSVAENLVFCDLELVSSGRFVNRRSVRGRARQLIERFDIKCPSPDTPMSQLSGGNQQRLVLARELSRSPQVIVAAQPTRGLDVGAIEYVTGQLRDARAAGAGVLLISTELEEILTLSDRVAVIFRGRIVGVMDREDAELEQLGLMMGGLTA
jgi:simple sugar transport system ATP-binding protein